MNLKIALIKHLAESEVALCKTDDELLKVEKRWKKFFAEMNRFIAGKREQEPYFSDDGDII